SIGSASYGIAHLPTEMKAARLSSRRQYLQKGCRGDLKGAKPPSISALLFELALDRVAVLLRTRGRRLTLALAFRLSARRGRPLSLLLLVHELADLLRRGLERLHRGLDPVGVVGLERVAQGGELLLDVLLRVGGHLVTELLERLLDGVRERVRLVARLDPLAVAAVVLGVHLRILDEARDLVLREAARRGDGDVLLATGRLVLCLHIHDAVRIDVEAHLDLRDPPRRGRYAVEDEASEALVVCGKLALALNDVDLDLRLPVARGREDLRLRGRDRAVALDELGGDATERLDDELLELTAGERDDEVLRTRLVRGDERQVDLGLLRRAELDLRLLGSFLETLERLTVAAQVDALVLLELLDQPVDDPLIEVVAAK